MKKTIIAALALSLAMPMQAQDRAGGHQAGTKADKTATRADSTIFSGYLYNDEYKVYLRIDFYHQDLIIPYQEVFGQMAGYFGDTQDGRKWLITDVTMQDSTTALLQICNDYGSEDLDATLRYLGQGAYELTQGHGSDIKIARNRKWIKMPKRLVFKKK